MRRVLLVAALIPVAVASAACATARLMKWQPTERAGVVAFPLLTIQHEPSAAAANEARQMIEHRCGGPFKVVEEGTTVSQGFAIGLYGGSTHDESTYYWAFTCEATTPRAGPSAPAEP